jgi:ribosomal protein S18 acetylase RimI-like enzyme
MDFQIRTMKMEDYDEVSSVWAEIHNFRIRSIDDSREGVERFLRRNPTTSMVAVCEGRIVGAILCGHDGRRGCLYHVCVKEEYRNHGIGRAMAQSCMRALVAEKINVVSLIAFKENTVGNHFWHDVGWNFREDLNYYDFTLNDNNITTKVE